MFKRHLSKSARAFRNMFILFIFLWVIFLLTNYWADEIALFLFANGL
jgi:hypothetical protein